MRLSYRWIVFLLAAFFVLRQFIVVADYADPGGPFRYLTHWALLLSFASASRMLAATEGRSLRDWQVLVAVTATINALVVFLYWRLYFQNPALVNSGPPPVWYAEYYLHILGPVLQWIDALFLFRGIRRYLPAAGSLLLLIAVYLGWIEGFVGPMNVQPSGSVTNGLPYPFLNNMDTLARAGFYAKTTVTGLVFLGVLWGAAAIIRRQFSPR